MTASRTRRHESRRPVSHPPVGERASLEAVIGGCPELGTIELEMRAGQGRDEPTFALQYASVALGLLRAHAAAMNEMETRLSRDLLEGIPADVAADRASAQGHDLGVPHDLIVCAWSSDTGPGVTTGTSIVSGRPWLISGCPAWMRQGRSLRPPRREQRLSLTERASNWVHSCTRTSGGRLTWARPTTATSTSEHQGLDSMAVARVGAPRGRGRRDCGALRRGR